GDLFWFDAALQSLSRFYKAPLTLLTKRQSQAQHLYKNSPYVKEILWVERPGRHGGFLGWMPLAFFLWRKKFSVVWIFHKSWTYRWACKLAGIPTVISYPADLRWLKMHPIERATLLLEKQGIPLLREPKFSVSETAKKHVKKKLLSYKKPWVAIGIGGTEPSKKWGSSHWEDLAVWLSRSQKMSVFLLGGPKERIEAAEMVLTIKNKGGEAVALTQFSLQESLAFLHQVTFFVGNDTGMMNGAAVLNKPTVALFLSSPPLSYRSSLVAVKPMPDTQDILLSQVQEAVDQILSSAK
ncbi:MAG: hypothetical protein A2065_03895, partial [Alphaproteobacteria bacterium GWB1_45_5]